MFDIEELKDKIKITDKSVECPVKGCNEKVIRQRKVFKRENRFKCPKHNIYISPSTFEYSNEAENLLWMDADDKDLFDKIKLVKREYRMARDNSEDAISLNVFRFLEKNNLVNDFIREVIGVNVKKSEVIYWSYSQPQENTWKMLTKGREEFEMVPSKGSEPDIIIKTDNTLFFIEAKFTATNKTIPRNKRVKDKYTMGGEKLWNKVFYSDFKTVAILNKKYELSRFWLIGSWIAKQLNLDFYLVNLVLSRREKNIEEIFNRHIKINKCRKFLRITWEDIYHYISNSNLTIKDKDVMIKYFKNKSIGYKNGRLQQAFSIIP